MRSRKRLMSGPPSHYFRAAHANRDRSNIYETGAHLAVQPPSMLRHAPVMEAASSLHRWRTSAAISSTLTKRLVG